MKTAKLVCPKCKHSQSVEVPQNKCLPFHECKQCKAVISVPKESNNCCVVCEYSDTKCPAAAKEVS